MLTRRTLLFVSGAASVLAVAPSVIRPARAQGDPGAAAFVHAVGQKLVAIVNGPGSLSEKRVRLQQVIDSAVDVDVIGQFCLGRFWRVATADQQRQYLQLFHDVLLNNITGNLGEYAGVSFTMGLARQKEDTAVVTTTVLRPNNPPAQVDWIIATGAGPMKVIDVVAEGTSLRLTQRSDYAAYLNRNGNNVQALIDAMRQQIGQNS
jgi:phospholipid transport system substrate-binding protein